MPERERIRIELFADGRHDEHKSTRKDGLAEAIRAAEGGTSFAEEQAVTDGMQTELVEKAVRKVMDQAHSIDL